MPKADVETVSEAPEGEPREHRRNRPPKNKPPRENRRPRREETEPEGGPTFWQKVAAVAKADWGPRAHVYLYRIEPRIDRSRSGNPNYITKYAEPISEDRVLADHGSGKYKLMLNFRKPGAEQGDEVDSLYLDILNMQFPPKVPPGEWVDDPANKRWAWAKQHFPRDGAERPAETIRETLELADAIRGSQAVDPVKATLDTIKAVRELQPPPARSATEDLSVLVSVAEKLRPPETVTAFMQAQFASLQAQIIAAQERADKLMDKLLDARMNGKQDSGVAAITQVTTSLKELLPAVKEFFPNLGEGIGGGGGSRLNGWQEFAVALGNSPVVGNIVSPLAAAFASALVGRFTGGARPGQPPAPPPAYQPPAPHQAPSQPAALPGAELMPFLAMIAPPMCNYIRTMAIPGNEPEAMGKDFAGWVFDGYGGDPRYMEAIQAARMMGPAGIITAFQSVPLWKDKGPNGMMVSLEELQAKLPAFFTAFLNYDPNAEDETDEDEDEETGPPEVVTYREANA